MMRARASWSWIALACAACGGDEAALEVSPLERVDVLTGTGGLGFGVGSIPPGPMMPFGMVRPGPDTSTNGGAPSFSHCAGYWYEDNEVRGFSQLHLSGTGVPDYGVVMIMPALELPAASVRQSHYAAELDHRREEARVGRYAIDLMPSRIRVELGATLRTALYHITYPEGQVQNLVLNVAHGLNGTTHTATVHVAAESGEITGSLEHEGGMVAPHTFPLHFVLKAQRPFMSVKSEGMITVLGLDPAAGRVLDLQIGVSFIDVETARKNLEAEWANYDLDAVERANREAWERVLSVVRVRGGTEEHQRRFYTALYDLQQMPTLMTEAEGRYRALDRSVRVAEGHTYYSDFSLWDTFRTFHPLMTLLDPAVQTDFVRSMMAMTEATGHVPKWPVATVETNTMIGYHGETVLVDSYLKNVGGLDGRVLYTWLRDAAFATEGSPSLRRRDCFERYQTLGFCPITDGGSASRTLENAFADFMLARLAEDLGESADAAALDLRAESWKNVLNSQGVVQGRNADGTFAPDFREDLFSDEFVEGNSRQWSAFVPHAIPAYAEVVGGDAALVAKLEATFEGAAAAEKTALPDLWYWHGNEPDIHASYMFAELGRSDLTERWVHWIVQNRYANGPAGLDGNDDAGTLSAWYVFSALGFFPKVGENRYVLGKPLFEEATLALPGGVFTIRANGLSETAIHVKSASLNGTRLTAPFISHAEVAAGGELVFEMTETPVAGAYSEAR